MSKDTQTVFLFDLDDTLLSYQGKVPRQTWHVLQDLKRRGYKMGLISNNPLLMHLASFLGLTEYIPVERILPRAHRNETRLALVKRWIELCLEPEFKGSKYDIYYFDDRADQVMDIQQDLALSQRVTAIHVPDLTKLHQQIHSLLPPLHQKMISNNTLVVMGALVLGLAAGIALPMAIMWFNEHVIHGQVFLSM